ncbi:MAG: hypothetical protein R2834_23680 [Rhodothermales bacterium]
MKLDAYFQVGHPVRMTIGALAVLFFLVQAIQHPAYKSIALVFVIVGLVGLYRDFLKRQESPPDSVEKH